VGREAGMEIKAVKESDGKEGEVKTGIEPVKRTLRNFPHDYA
jgi:hypothetical protein